MNSNWAKRVIHDIALRKKLKDEVVRAIINSQFEALRSEFTDSDFENEYIQEVRLPGLCTFWVKPNRVNHFRGKDYYRNFQQQRRKEKYNSAEDVQTGKQQT